MSQRDTTIVNCQFSIVNSRKIAFLYDPTTKNPVQFITKLHRIFYTSLYMAAASSLRTFSAT